jgi:hypothetical protein
MAQTTRLGPVFVVASFHLTLRLYFVDNNLRSCKLSLVYYIEVKERKKLTVVAVGFHDRRGRRWTRRCGVVDRCRRCRCRCRCRVVAVVVVVNMSAV